MADETNGWQEWKRVVLSKLEDNATAIRQVSEHVTEELGEVRREVTNLRLEMATTNQSGSQMQRKVDKHEEAIIKSQLDMTDVRTRLSMWAGLFGFLGGAICTAIIRYVVGR